MISHLGETIGSCERLLYNSNLMPHFIHIPAKMTFAENSASWITANPYTALFLLVFTLFLLSVIILLLKPINTSVMNSKPNPISDFVETLRRIDKIRHEEGARGDLSKGGRTILLHHGRKVDDVIVFLHGFTSAPQQFAVLGGKFFDQGFNVYIPRKPRHGYVDTLSPALKDYNARMMVDFTSRVIDLARGLGERVTIVGLSGGGTMAAWAGQYRPDVYHAGSIAPSLGAGFIPAPLTKMMTKLMLGGPNFYMWWDPIKKANNPIPEDYQYPGYQIHALGEVLRLGYAVEEEARLRVPRAEKVTMVSNANDVAVSNERIEQLVTLWTSKGEQVTHYQFPKEYNLAHDFITPTREGFRADIVYPTLLKLFADGK